MLRLTAGDGSLTSFDSVQVTVANANGTTTVDVAITVGSDDVEQNMTNNTVNLNNADLELGADGTVAQQVGLRFPGVSIPRGATITNAYVQFTADEIPNVSASLLVQGHAVDNAPAFANTAGNVSNRARTATQVSWNPPVWTAIGAAGIDQQTPNLSPIVQELVNRTGWASGNAMVVIVSGTGRRVAEPFEGGAALAPRLHVEYIVGPPVNVAPVVSAGSDAVVTLPASASLSGSVSDDGLPSNTLTSLWSVVSGPGTVTFGNAAAPVTTASFSSAGTYVLRLTGNDSLLSTSDDVQITVNPVSPVNVAPVVSAGSDAVVTLPASASLSGSVSDDGLPSNTLTSLWSVVSGPGTVTFGNAAAPVTTASFSSAGTYVLRLTGNDSLLSTSDDVQITVNPVSPVNVAPVVSAGSDAVVTLPASASLSGSVSDDGLPSNTLTSLWSVVSGPGTVTFGNAAAPVTTASFSSAGTYVLRLTGNDSLLSTSDDVQITVNPVGPGSFVVDLNLTGNTNDVEQFLTTNVVDLASSDLELGADGATAQQVGLRFPGVNIPAGATIANAWVQFTVDEVSTGATSLAVVGEAADNSAAFAATVNNVSSRLRTAASVPWVPAAWPTIGVAGADQRTPNIATIVQQIVNRGGWASGNALTVIVSGTGRRTAEAVESGAAIGPKLHVEYTTGTGPFNAAPIVAAGADQSIVLPSSANLSGSASDDGQPSNTLTSLWSVVSGPGTVSFGNAAAPVTTASFSTAGTYVLRLTANDTELSSSDDVQVVVAPVGGSLVLEVALNGAANDAEQSLTTNVTDVGSSDLELGQDRAIAQQVGLRFTGLNVPGNATITNAWVQFTIDEVSNAAASLSVVGEAADNSAIFTTALNNISSRARTVTTVPWTPATWPTVGAAGVGQRTPNLAAVVQQIVSRPGWLAGNALTLIVAGTGRRTAVAFESGAALAPKLHVEYTLP